MSNQTTGQDMAWRNNEAARIEQQLLGAAHCGGDCGDCCGYQKQEPLQFKAGNTYAWIETGVQFRIHRVLQNGNAQVLIRTLTGDVEDCETILLTSLREGVVYEVLP